MIYGAPEFAAFLQAAAGGTPTYLAAWRGERLVGLLPFFERRAATGDAVINSLPWYGSHGGCLLAPEAGDEERRALLRRFAVEVAERRPLTATLVLTPQEEPHVATYEALLPVQARSARIGQVSPLPPDGPDLTEALLARAHDWTRRMVRKSMRQGFALELADDDPAWRFLHEVHAENMAAMGGRAKPWAHFEALRRHIPPSMRRLHLARAGDEPVAALLLLVSGETVEYVTPVIRHDWRSLQPMSALILAGMTDAVRSGCRWWNWGGTWLTQNTLYDFKRRWGAEDRPYTYLIVAPDDPRPRLRAIGDLAALFPWYYVFPYEAL
jgi:hypothetical protein